MTKSIPVWIQRDELPDNLKSLVQNHTNAPWWNGRAYCKYHGYYACCIKAAVARNELDVVIAALREERQFAFSDALRDIAARLDKAARFPEPGLHRARFQDLSGDFQNRFCGGAPGMTWTGTA